MGLVGSDLRDPHRVRAGRDDGGRGGRSQCLRGPVSVCPCEENRGRAYPGGQGRDRGHSRDFPPISEVLLPQRDKIFDEGGVEPRLETFPAPGGRGVAGDPGKEV